MDLQAYTPQVGLQNCLNITATELLQRMHALRDIGYSVHRRRDMDGTHEDNDWVVLIERTDGKPVEEILRGWQR